MPSCIISSKYPNQYLIIISFQNMYCSAQESEVQQSVKGFTGHSYKALCAFWGQRPRKKPPVFRLHRLPTACQIWLGSLPATATADQFLPLLLLLLILLLLRHDLTLFVWACEFECWICCGASAGSLLATFFLQVQQKQEIEREREIE